MKRTVLLLAAIAGLLATDSAQAAKKSCTGSGATIVALAGKVSVISTGDHDSPTYYGCWIPTGRRFLLIKNQGLETDTFEIVGDRYIGMRSNEYAGVETHVSASSWDARKRVRVHDTSPCARTPLDPNEDETTYGPDSVRFLSGGALAYTCPDVSSHIADATGDRLLEPNGVAVTDLAASGSSLYYTVGGTVKKVAIAQVAKAASAAKKKTCTGTTIAAAGNVSIVSAGDPDNPTYYGCWVPAGKRFKLFQNNIEDDTWSLGGGPYIGVYRSLDGAEGGGGDARSWDAKTGKRR